MKLYDCSGHDTVYNHGVRGGIRGFQNSIHQNRPVIDDEDFKNHIEKNYQGVEASQHKEAFIHPFKATAIYELYEANHSIY